MTRKKREGTHYKSRKKKDDEYYSLRSLVPEITGVEKGGLGFDAARKSLERLVGTFQSLEGIDKGTIKIHKDRKEGFVKATKAFFENEGEFGDLLKKLRNDKSLSLEEHDLLIDHFSEALKTELNKEEAKKLEEHIKQMKGDEFDRKKEQIEQLIIKDVQLADKVKDQQAQIKYMDEYIDILQQTLQQWREQVVHHMLYEKAYERIVERKPELRQLEPISANNMTPELLTEIMIEVIKIQHETNEDTEK